VASCGLYDRPERVHNDLWLIDRHSVTGVLTWFHGRVEIANTKSVFGTSGVVTESHHRAA
jgi:hypothetical protein